jgi:fumarate reductase subunit D
VSPLIKNKADAIIRIAVAIALYFLYATVDFSFLPAFLQFIVESICRYSIWFVIGMCISAFDLHKYFKKPFGLFFVAFAILGTLLIKFSISFTGARLLLGLIACFGVINFIGAIYNKKSQTKIFAFLSKYTTPIFLMHTIFAAGVRIVLNKIGVDNAVIHVVAGLVASFGLPIIASVIMEKLRLDILYNPTKYIKIK